MEALLKLFHYEFVDYCKKYEPPLTNKEQSSVDSMRDSTYINDTIREHLGELTNVTVCDNVNLRIYHKPREQGYLMEFLVFFTGFMKRILPRVSSKSFDVSIEIFLTSPKKKFPKKKNEILAPVNVNSGVTFWQQGTTKKHVIVFRKEEVFKVLVHELIHAYELDIHAMSLDIEEPIRRTFFKHGVVLRINESITDTLACFINVVMYCLITSENSRISMRLFRSTLAAERNYILMKGLQAFKWEGYSYDHKTKQVDNAQDKLTEKTHVTSYYVLKAVNFWALDKFFALRRPFDEVEYVDHLMQTLNDPRFWKRFLKFHNRSMATQSLRMSHTDIISIVNSHKRKLLKALMSR